VLTIALAFHRLTSLALDHGIVFRKGKAHVDGIELSDMGQFGTTLNQVALGLGFQAGNPVTGASTSV